MEKAIKILYIGNSFENLLDFQADSRISITHRHNALEAIRYLQKGGSPNAILCDMAISGGDGLEMHALLRKDPQYLHIAFILLAPEFNEDLFKQAFHDKVDDYFVYPLQDLESMLSRISFLVEYRSKALLPVMEPDEQKIEYIMPRSKRIFDILCSRISSSSLTFAVSHYPRDQA